MKMYVLGSKGRFNLGQKAKAYVAKEFGFQKTVDLWHETMIKTIQEFPYKRKNYRILEL